jgi:L-2-hydroxyglutarate oxidase LhgO
MALEQYAQITPSTGCPTPAIIAKIRPQIIKRDSALLKEAMNLIKAQSECTLNPPAEDCVISSVGSWPQAASLEF